MEETSPQTPEDHCQETHTQKLQRQFNNLERCWDSFKHSNPPGTRTRTRTRTRTDNDAAAGILNSPRFLGPCPGNLISSRLLEASPLQSESESEPEISAAGTNTWKVWTNDLAFEEEDIHQQRRVAIDAGKLEGRCLQEALEGAVGDRSTTLEGVTGICSFINCSDGPAVDDSGRDEASYKESSSSCRCSSYCSSPSSDPENKRMKRQGGLPITAGRQRRQRGKNNVASSGRSRRLWKFVFVMTGIALMVLALLDPRRFLEGDETVITVPT